MRNVRSTGSFVIGCMLTLASAAFAQTRTPWQMNYGLGVDPLNPRDPSTQDVAFDCSPGFHGDPCEYDVAVVPPATDTNWFLAPDPNTIGYDVGCTLPDGESGSL